MKVLKIARAFLGNILRDNSLLAWHEKYMRKALLQAHCAYRRSEVPIGAVIVDKYGVIVGRGYNRAEGLRCQSGHAEMRAIAAATRRVKNWRLDGMWIYSTLEPCAMCVGLILLSRFCGIVYGASSPLYGSGLDRLVSSRVYKKNIPVIVTGVLNKEAATLLQSFFKNKREYRGA